MILAPNILVSICFFVVQSLEFLVHKKQSLSFILRSSSHVTNHYQLNKKTILNSLENKT